MPVFPLAGLLQPFNQQSPMNMASMLAQAGIQDPSALAALLASSGAAPPPVKDVAPLPTIGKILQDGAQNLAPQAAIPTPSAPIPQAPQGAQGAPPGRLEGILQAISQLKAPPAPQPIQPPGAISPGGPGPAPNPQLLAQLAQLLQSGQPTPVPSLGQLIAGSAQKGPALTL